MRGEKEEELQLERGIPKRIYRRRGVAPARIHGRHPQNGTAADQRARALTGILRKIEVEVSPLSEPFVKKKATLKRDFSS